MGAHALAAPALIAIELDGTEIIIPLNSGEPYGLAAQCDRS